MMNKNNFILFLSIICIFIFALYFVYLWGKQGLLIFVSLVTILFYMGKYTNTSREGRLFLFGLFISFVVAGCYINARIIYFGYEKPPEFDFLVYWFSAKVAAYGHNFYLPANFLQVADELKFVIDFQSEFYQEIIKVGFWYPPISMLIFLPLGYFNKDIAYLILQFVNSIIIGVNIYLLWKIYLGRYGKIGLIGCASLLLWFPPTRATFSYAQTNFIMLLFVLLFIKNIGYNRSGFWLSLAILVKPIAAFLCVIYLFRKMYISFLILVCSLATLSLISVLLFGPETVIAYFTDGPTQRIPFYIFTENSNQSLLAVILRNFNTTANTANPLSNYLYIVVGTIFTVISILIVKNSNTDNEYAAILIILLALIVYPNTNNTYSVLLIIPFLYTFNYIYTTMNKVIPIFIVFSLVIVVLSSESQFVANFLFWVIFVFFGVKGNDKLNKRIRYVVNQCTST